MRIFRITIIFSLLVVCAFLWFLIRNDRTSLFILNILLGPLFILLAANIYALYSMTRAMISGAPFAPTPMLQVKKMISLSGLTAGERMLDIGSGDGRIVWTAAQTGAACAGIELQLFFYLLGKQEIKKRGLKNAVIRRGSLWEEHFHDVDVLTLFFIPHKMKKLEQKIKQEMRPGSRVVSYAFQFPSWQPALQDGRVRVYIV